MIIDTHTHLNFKAYDNDRDEVIKRAQKESVVCINVGTKYQTSKQAVEIAEKYNEGIYAAIGLHPIYAAAEFQKVKTDPEEGEFLIKEENYNKEKYLRLAQSKKVVAIGEIGLDYYYRPKTNTKLEQFKNKQKEIFLQQLETARELNLPVILHCRMAHTDLIEILKSQIPSTKFQTNPKFKAQNPKLGGVIHCFTGSWEDAQKYMNMGFYLGINGIIFKYNIDGTIREIPLDKILVETDCPYLTPPQEEKPVKSFAFWRIRHNTRSAGFGRRNEPIFVKHIIQKIADLKGISFDKVANKTTENARKLFNI